MAGLVLVIVLGPEKAKLYHPFFRPDKVQSLVAAFLESLKIAEFSETAEEGIKFSRFPAVYHSYQPRDT